MRLFYAPVKSLESFLKPLYQDLDGVSRFDDVERIGAIARRLTTPSRELELLILFHALPGWLDKLGNRSRTVLTCDVSESELHKTAASLKRLDHPVTDAERALASAIAIDNAGIYGLARELSRARREGRTIEEVAREVVTAPEWMSDEAREMFEERAAKRREMCRELLREVRTQNAE